MFFIFSYLEKQKYYFNDKFVRLFEESNYELINVHEFHCQCQLLICIFFLLLEQMFIIQTHDVIVFAAKLCSIYSN